MQGDQVQPPVRRISCQQSVSPVGSHESWNPSQGGRCGHFSEAQSADCLMLPWQMRRRTSGSFLYLWNCKFLMYMDVIEDAIQRIRTRCELKILGSTHL